MEALDFATELGSLAFDLSMLFGGIGVAMGFAFRHFWEDVRAT